MSFNFASPLDFEEFFRAGEALDSSILNWTQTGPYGPHNAFDGDRLAWPWSSTAVDNDFSAAPVAPIYAQHQDERSDGSQFAPQLQLELELLQQQLAAQSQAPYQQFPTPDLQYAQSLHPSRDAVSTAVSNEPVAPRVPCPAADCTCTFVNKAGLRKHQKLKHTGGKPQRINCLQCTKTFADRKGLKRHCDRHHAVNDKVDKFACPGCKKKYDRQDFVVRHMKTHHPDLVNHGVTDGRRILHGVRVERESVRKARSRAC
ncbi:hypothetical protein AMS68_006233 [Peltaster fructicola]|uniref:C2H2-type domain-containing protein n=1 Tax=Peltaster fructicola TaxID=286661 RepID=A0A6H0Y199_9PEZI|nr:hypothetical protein AMS68_006233 [Peltaster fructicola]